MNRRELAELAEEHIREALQRAEDGFPAIRVDSWTDPAVSGQWVILHDREGRPSQARLDYPMGASAGIRPGTIARAADGIVAGVLEGLWRFASDGALIVSRPLPDPDPETVVHSAQIDFRGVWFRLMVRPGESGELLAVLMCLIGRHIVPLAESSESVVWL